MKKTLLTLILSTLILNTKAQIAIFNDTKGIPGLCNDTAVYGFLFFPGQHHPKASIGLKAIEKRLNADLKFLKDHPDYTASKTPQIDILINCKGEALRYEMEPASDNAELDQQIIALFKTFGPWKAGRIKKQQVDSKWRAMLFVRDGKISFHDTKK